MFLPTIEDDNNSRSAITTWLGYNHNYNTNDGEFYDMENMSSDRYPLLSPRKTRPLLVSTAAEYDARVDAIRLTNTVVDSDAQPASGDYWNDTANDILYHYVNSAWVETDHKKVIRGLLLTDNKVAYLADDILHYNEHEYNMSAYMSAAGLKTDQQLLRFGSYILIFPEGAYINISDTTDIGRISTSYSAGTGATITYQMTDSAGASLQNVVASDTAPTSPANGDYWLCTATGAEGLNIWDSSKSMWTAVATSYIKISIPGATLKSLFDVGDTVTLNSSIADINSGSVIQAMGNDYILVIGLIANGVSKTDVTDSLWTLTITRKLPKLDYVCVDDNRVWGCYYGDDGNGGIVNEIYASKLGDFKNWYSYQGVSTDSYAISLGTDGGWTGCISYGGYPTFFKENSIMRIFGSQPSAYQLSTTNCRGVQKGSSKSLAIVREYLIYKSPQDIVVYDGSTPTGISGALGNDARYYDAVGGGCLDKYYVSMQDTLGKHVFLIYDMSHGIWEKESSIKANCFTTAENGQAYVASSDELYGVGANDNSMYLNPLVGEEYVSWYAETGDMGLDVIGYKTISRITVRASVPIGANIEVQISYDDGAYQTLQSITGNGTLLSYTMGIPAVRCDHYRVKLVGHGDVRVYSLAINAEERSEENGEYNL